MCTEPFEELAQLLAAEIPVSVPPLDVPYVDGDLDWTIIDGPVDLLAVAAAVVAKGWHPPDRTIETLEELEALPVESVVQVIRRAEDADDPVAVVWVHASPGEWVEPGSVDRHPASEVDLPVWLRWSPHAKTDAHG